MFDEITGEKKVCIKRKIYNSIFIVLIFENIITLLPHGNRFEKLLGFIRDITKDNKKDRLNLIF